MKTSICVLTWLVLVVPCQARVIYVDVNTPDNNDGSSWGKAYKYLQDGLGDAELSGDVNEIWVAQGIYTPDSNTAVPDGTGDREATFQLVNGVALRGGYSGNGEPDPNIRDYEVYETILSGDLDNNDVNVNSPDELETEPTRSENSFHVVSCTGVDVTAILDGVTITAGYANDSYPNNRGGGIFSEHSDCGSPMVISCTIRGNYASNDGGGVSECCGLILNSTISANYAGDEGGGLFQYGKVENCVIIGNTAGQSGGGSRFGDPIINCIFTRNSAKHGGGMYVGAVSTVTSCTFTDNSASVYGGGIFSYGSFSVPVISNCTFISNSSSRGGGMANNYGASPTLINCIFSRNNGGGVNHLYSSSRATYTNCTFVTGGLDRPWGDPDNLQVKNCIFWDCGISDAASSTITVTYTNIPGGWSGPGGHNIDINPNFADPCNGDFHLQSQAGRYDPNTETWFQDANTSPCIDAGDPTSPIGLEPFPNGGRINMGTYGGTTEASKSYFGEPICEIIVAGDINGDCIINFKDLAIMGLHWLKDNNE